MKFKPSATHVRRPSGIYCTKDNKYFFWSCTISGCATFAKVPRFERLVKLFGSEENLYKNFICLSAKQYIAIGRTHQEIREMVDSHGDLPRLGAKTMKHMLHSKNAKTRLKKEKKTVEEVVESVSILKPAKVKKVKKVVEKVVEKSAPVSKAVDSKVVYDWSHDPSGYFSSGQTVSIMSPEEATKDTCAYPGRYLDDECRGCSIYDRCAFAGKYTSKDWEGPRKKSSAPVIKKLSSWEDDKA